MLKSAAKQKMVPLQYFLNMPVTTWPTITSQGLSPLNVVICPKNIWTFVWLGYMVFVSWKCLLTFVLNSSQLLRIHPFMTFFGGSFNLCLRRYKKSHMSVVRCLRAEDILLSSHELVQLLDLCLFSDSFLSEYYPQTILSQDFPYTVVPPLHHQRYTLIDTNTSHYISDLRFNPIHNCCCIIQSCFLYL